MKFLKFWHILPNTHLKAVYKSNWDWTIRQITSLQLHFKLHTELLLALYLFATKDHWSCVYPTGLGNSSQQQFFSSALRFLQGALQVVEGEDQARVSPVWAPWWEEVCELWRLSLQALGGCVNAQPWIATLIREEGWLQNILNLLKSSSGLPDAQSQDALEEALCAIAHKCPLCRQDISVYMKRDAGDSIHCMPQLSKMLMS